MFTYLAAILRPISTARTWVVVACISLPAILFMWSSSYLNHSVGPDQFTWQNSWDLIALALCIYASLIYLLAVLLNLAKQAWYSKIGIIAGFYFLMTLSLSIIRVAVVSLFPANDSILYQFASTPIDSQAGQIAFITLFAAAPILLMVASAIAINHHSRRGEWYAYFTCLFAVACFPFGLPILAPKIRESILQGSADRQVADHLVTYIE